MERELVQECQVCGGPQINLLFSTSSRPSKQIGPQASIVIIKLKWQTLILEREMVSQQELQMIQQIMSLFENIFQILCQRHHYNQQPPLLGSVCI